MATKETTRRRDERADDGRCRPPWPALGPILLLAGCALGEYRMPYKDGTLVEVARDHVTHPSPDAYMYDLEARNASPAEIVAAAPGWVRFIEDGNQEPTDENNFVWIEHPYPFCPVDPNRADWPGKPANYDSTCIPCDRDFCNEWTTYGHFAKDSVRGDAELSEGDWVEAGHFLGFEDEVGVAYGVHLHWHVSVMPPDATPVCNGYFLDCDEVSTAQLPEVIPIVCHQGGPSVLWRNGIYTAADCPARAPLPGSSPQLSQPRPRSPLDEVIQRVARITDEGIRIALADPPLMARTRQLMMRLEPDFQDLLRLGSARISETDLRMVLDLLAEYDSRGSRKMRLVLDPIDQLLQSPRGRRGLGLIVEQPFQGLD